MRGLAELMSLRGRTALVTGGAGRLGRAIGEALAELGAAVVLLDRDPHAAAAAAERLRDRHGVDSLPLAVDLLDADAAERAAAGFAERFEGLDVLVHNAAFVGTSALEGWAVPFPAQRVETWRAALEVNLTAPFTLTQALLPHLRRAAGGRASVIAVASIYGLAGPDWRLYEGTGMSNPAAYAASKGGLVQLTRWLATTLAPAVRVNAIAPGGIARGQDPAFVARYEARTPLGRMATEEDFEGAVAYLASDLSAYVTGQTLAVDGGWLAW